MEEEVAAVDVAEADPAHRVAAEGGEQLAGRFDRVVGHADGAGEDVGRAAREHAEGGGRPGQAVGRLVEGPVAAEDDDGVEPVGGRALGQPGGMAPPAGLGDG